MKKQILFSLLLIPLTSSAMEQEQKPNTLCIFHNYDYLDNLIQPLCFVNRYDAAQVNKTITSLALTDTTLCKYFLQEHIGRKIVNLIHEYSCEDHLFTAKRLKLPISNTIKDFLRVAYNKYLNFSDENLTTHGWCCNIISSNLPVVDILITQRNLRKVQQLVHAPGIQLTQTDHSYYCPLQATIFLLTKCFNRPNEKNNLLEIAQLLLEKNSYNLDKPISKTLLQWDPRFSLLMHAINNNQKKLTHLLMTHKANPNEITIIRNESHQAFDVEKGEPKGWSKDMWEQIQNDVVKNNSTTKK